MFGQSIPLGFAGGGPASFDAHFLVVAGGGYVTNPGACYGGGGAGGGGLRSL